MEENKTYAEMSMEELKKELSFAEMEAKQEKKLLDKTEFFTPEYTARKAEYDATQGEINAIKSEIFGRNQKEALSKLNDTSKNALEEYYQFHTEGPGTAKTVMTFFGIYDGNARKMDSDNLKENAMNALEAQGISKEEFPKMYEYYKFQRDAERTAANTAELKENYANSGAFGKTAMNVGTVLNAPVRGLAASTEALASLTYEDEYAPLNINSTAYDMTNFTDTVRSEAIQDIDSGVGKFLYQTGMSVADFGATVPLTALPGGQAAALTSMGMNAGTSAAKDATLRGVSKEQALTTGLTSAAIEVATEKLPLDNCVNIFKNGGKATVNIAKQAGIEGTEEMIAEVGNTLADNYINGNQSQFNQNVQFYINTGMTQEAAQKYAHQDMVRGVGLSFLGGALSGGGTGTGAQFIGGSMTEINNSTQTDELTNGNYRVDEQGVLRYKTDPSKEAWSWQGTDAFAGKDNYENKVLEGTKKDIYLVKLEGSSSGYFTLLEDYEKLKGADGKVSAVTLSEGLQVAPWENEKAGQYEYRSQVAIYKLESDMEVGYGSQTTANHQYGEGMLTQIYIPGYDAKNQANNDAIGLKRTGTEDLKDVLITENRFKQIEKENAYHIAKRDVFLFQAEKDRVLQVMKQTSDQELQATCQSYLDELDARIEEYKDILKKYKSTIGELPSQTYDDMNIYLAKKNSQNVAMESENQPNLESKVADVREDLIRQIEEEMKKPPEYRNIEITNNIQKVYEIDKFCTEVQAEGVRQRTTERDQSEPFNISFKLKSQDGNSPMPYLVRTDDAMLEIQNFMPKLYLVRTADGKLEAQEANVDSDNSMKQTRKIASALEKKITDDLLR